MVFLVVIWESIYFWVGAFRVLLDFGGARLLGMAMGMSVAAYNLQESI